MQAQPNETWFARVREVIASAWEGGWTDVEIQKMVERTVREESARRTVETARKLYGGGEKCPACRGTGGGQYNDCPTCGGNGDL